MNEVIEGPMARWLADVNAGRTIAGFKYWRQMELLRVINVIPVTARTMRTAVSALNIEFTVSVNPGIRARIDCKDSGMRRSMYTVLHLQDTRLYKHLPGKKGGMYPPYEVRLKTKDLTEELIQQALDEHIPVLQEQMQDRLVKEHPEEFDRDLPPPPTLQEICTELCARAASKYRPTGEYTAQFDAPGHKIKISLLAGRTPQGQISSRYQVYVESTDRYSRPVVSQAQPKQAIHSRKAWTPELLYKEVKKAMRQLLLHKAIISGCKKSADIKFIDGKFVGKPIIPTEEPAK